MDNQTIPIAPSHHQNAHDSQTLSRFRATYDLPHIVKTKGASPNPGPAAVADISQKARELARAEEIARNPS